MPKKIKKISGSSISSRQKPGTKKLICTGNSAQDYAELRIYVENGCTNKKNKKGGIIKLLTARQVQAKYPQFLWYDSHSFASVLYWMKKQAMMSVDEQEMYR